MGGKICAPRAKKGITPQILKKSNKERNRNRILRILVSTFYLRWIYILLLSYLHFLFSFTFMFAPNLWILCTRRQEFEIHTIIQLVTQIWKLNLDPLTKGVALFSYNSNNSANRIYAGIGILGDFTLVKN